MEGLCTAWCSGLNTLVWKRVVGLISFDLSTRDFFWEDREVGEPIFLNIIANCLYILRPIIFL